MRLARARLRQDVSTGERQDCSQFGIVLPSTSLLWANHHPHVRWKAGRRSRLPVPFCRKVDMAEVVYLTGAPASGKSSLARELSRTVPSLRIFEFGAHLAAHLAARGQTTSQRDLRTVSASAITPEDVHAVDAELMAFVDAHRSSVPILIDSHAVTKESYGYRVTPFSLSEFARLRPTQIWAVYAEPEVVTGRIARKPEGRPSITPEEARMHTYLQASVAITYAMHLGLPVHFFNSGDPSASLVPLLTARLTRT